MPHKKFKIVDKTLSAKVRSRFVVGGFKQFSSFFIIFYYFFLFDHLPNSAVGILSFLTQRGSLLSEGDCLSGMVGL